MKLAAALLGPMRPREKLVGLHFQQAAQGALKLEHQPATGVQVLQFNLGRDDQLDVAIVELVDHVDEAPGDVVGGDVHLLDAAEQHRGENLAQFDVIVLAARPVAQFAEVEPCHVVTGTQGTDLAILDHQHVVFDGFCAIRGQRLEAFAHAFLRGVVEREMEQLSLLKVTQTIVNATVDVDDVGVLLDQRNGWQKARSLQTVLVQAVRNDVGRRDQGHAILEQLFHQRAEDHGVGDVGNEEFVEADDPRLVGKTLGDDRQRVSFALEGLHLFVHALHEAVEVRTDLVLERQRFKERVDQISLAATHTTPEIQALDQGRLFLAKQLAEQAWLAVVSGDQILIKALQMAHSVFLRGIMKEVRAFQISLISF
ncbi:Uncharacterized protein ALO54_05713 [Pseudomonas syringae pv. philadelphi]|nr:Uncharacterized protein ALO54_05713 [Pseudomonas syringae pv. philadelphi]